MGMAEWNSKNPFPARLVENRALTGPASKKETRHIVFSLADSGLEYKAGDALGVLPHCPTELVEATIQALGVEDSTVVETATGEATLHDALCHRYEIHRVNKRSILNLAAKFADFVQPVEMRLVERSRQAVGGGESMHWEWSGADDDFPEGFAPLPQTIDPAYDLWGRLVNDDEAMEEYIWSRDYLDMLGDFGHLGITAQEFVDGLDRMKPRLYSIASSPEHDPGAVHLTVAIIRYNYHGRDRTGLATGYLADHCETSLTEVGVFVSPTRSFILPEDETQDIIMVGPGTGLAPFRAFLQQREKVEATGRNWLFFGEWTEANEFIYQDEIESWQRNGTLDRVDLAWSREGPEKVYVQHLMEQNGAEIWQWLENGAHFFVCGDKNKMARDVHATLIRICAEHGSMSDDDAKHFVERTLMKEQKRYLRDVY